jgi:hypothetical protein
MRSVYSISLMSAAGLILAARLGWAQQIYKWVDESGVVHYGESVPAGVESYEAVNLAPAPAAPAAVPRQAPAPRAASQPRRPAETPAPTAAPTRPPEAMSLAELDQQCELARETEIAPLRAAAIDECKAKPRANAAYCERYYATFGDAVAIRPGEVTPRMFDDLPACALAQEERRRRAR